MQGEYISSYSNSTARPENISKEEWELRRKTWEEAFIPDYIPMNHGFLVQLFDTKHIHYRKNLDNINLLSPEEVIKKLKNTYKGAEELPNYPGNDGTMSDYTKFYTSQEYKNWQKKFFCEFLFLYFPYSSPAFCNHYSISEIHDVLAKISYY